MTSPWFRHEMPLQLSPKGLYLLDINEIIQAQKSCTQGISPAAETFHSSDQCDRKQDVEPSTSTPNHTSAPLKTPKMGAPLGDKGIKGKTKSVRFQESESVAQQDPSAGVSTTTSREEAANQQHFASSDFLQLVRRSLPSEPQHGSVQPLRSCHGAPAHRLSDGVQTDVNGPDGRLHSAVRQSPHGKDISGSVEHRASLAPIHPEQVLHESNTRASEDRLLLPTEDRTPGTRDGIARLRESEQTVIAPKAKAKAKSQAAPNLMDTASVISETWEVPTVNATEEEVMGLQSRMYQLENVMQEVLAHLRQHAEP